MADAVILVSGGAAVTPYTDPDCAAGSGLAAGNTLTALRAHLLDRGVRVFTAPARLGPGVVERDAGWQGFDDVPLVLPAEMTVNAVGAIDDAGVALAAFVRWVAEQHGLGHVDLVGHSMGGLFSRAAIRELATDGLRVDHLVTLGTPWDGAVLGDLLDDEISEADAHGDPATLQILAEVRPYAAANSEGAAAEVSRRFLRGWNERQTGVLDDVPVTAVGAGYFAAATEPSQLWPHDGLVSLRSGRADDVPAAVLPRVERHSFPDDVHSIFFADAFGLPWERALTWDPRVFAVVDEALRM
ncbi:MULTISPECIES: triacylglycerol lipase [Microbacterium]|uniref:esterase/lipase family protein n=1 Tax=Microbacterium TaxID=33882 RepID=UPI00278B626D|nr:MULTISPECIES: alpha/beta fold hydrolase [Microbacterium]MDQ1085170.1 triacylglycerol lipase [Microbacterium sp. SORGH_AS_0344]MDQ1169524.1 triacylglycerol lipase [Microbacterium proteolyticum]